MDLCIVLRNWFYIVVPAVFFLLHLAHFRCLLLRSSHGECPWAHWRKHGSLKAERRLSKGPCRWEMRSEEGDLGRVLHGSVNFLGHSMLVRPVFGQNERRIVKRAAHRLRVHHLSWVYVGLAPPMLQLFHTFYVGLRASFASPLWRTHQWLIKETFFLERV